MSNIKNIKSIGIQAKRWFQKTYGNTYHSVKIVIEEDGDNWVTLHCPITYGYGQQWNQTALDLFTKHYGIEIDKYSNGTPKHSYLTSFLRDNNISHHAYESDVMRKKDL